MPKKIRQLKQDLLRAGYCELPGREYTTIYPTGVNQAYLILVSGTGGKSLRPTGVSFGGTLRSGWT